VEGRTALDTNATPWEYNGAAGFTARSLATSAVRREKLMSVPFSEQELADYIFDRIIVHCPKCPDVDCIRVACMKVADDLLEQAEIVYRTEPVSDGGA
jgi:hypothetical protein